MIIRMNPDSPDTKPTAAPAQIGWRLLALVYDAVIGLALLFVVSALSLAILPGHNPVTPGSAASYAVFAAIWGVFGAYATLSWRFGGQTIGMKPWRLKVVDALGRHGSWRQLWLRYAVASLTLGAALLWSPFDRDRRGLHDIAAGTLFVRLQPKSA
jgi:uncharacterized RDD family membrane protein YckC